MVYQAFKNVVKVNMMFGRLVHSSTALSAAVAMAIARDLNKESFNVVPVVGDGAIVGGESLEALNHLGSINNKVILILNDNQMSIPKSIGGMNNFLNNVRMSNTI